MSDTAIGSPMRRGMILALAEILMGMSLTCFIQGGILMFRGTRGSSIYVLAGVVLMEIVGIIMKRIRTAKPSVREGVFETFFQSQTLARVFSKDPVRGYWGVGFVIVFMGTFFTIGIYITIKAINFFAS